MKGYTMYAIMPISEIGKDSIRSGIPMIAWIILWGEPKTLRSINKKCKTANIRRFAFFISF